MFDKEKYIKFVEEMWVTKNEPLTLQIGIASLGIGGETGEVLKAIITSQLEQHDQVKVELGDVLFYIFTLCRLLEISTNFSALHQANVMQYFEKCKKYNTSYNTLIIKASKVQEHLKKHLRNPVKCPVNKEYLHKTFNHLIWSIIYTADLYAFCSLRDVVEANYAKLSYREKEDTLSDVAKRVE